MSFSGFSFAFWRVFQILTLIPTLGMLAWFVHIYDNAGALTPRSILIIFIVSVLAAAWAIGTLFLYVRAKHSAGFVALIDLLFVGAFIGAVYELAWITNENCTHVNSSRFEGHLGGFYASGPGFSIHTDKPCAMLKASFAFGIMNCIFFFITFLLALLVHRHYDHHSDRVVVKREYHSSRHGHRSHRSRSPRHSHHSRRGSYV